MVFGRHSGTELICNNPLHVRTSAQDRSGAEAISILSVTAGGLYSMRRVARVRARRSTLNMARDREIAARKLLMCAA
jgi:hypothetical protein